MLSIGPLEFGTDDVLRKVVEARKSSEPAKRDLVVLLDTLGGYIEVVSRIVDTLRYHYDVVAFIIPNSAYSAGTVLAMSGDSIHMDYYSRLGPIDPQVESDNSEMVPALGYLKRYEKLIEGAKSEEGLSLAEIQLLISGFNQAQLYKYEQARELSVTLLTDWLCKYKFRDWIKTETRGIEVTDDMRKERAEDIARRLSDTDRWHAHGHGISPKVLWSELRLKIDGFGDKKDVVSNYYDLLMDYMGKSRISGVVHSVGQFAPYHVH